jgi:hypothetical protein
MVKSANPVINVVKSANPTPTLPYSANHSAKDPILGSSDFGRGSGA